MVDFNKVCVYAYLFCGRESNEGYKLCISVYCGVKHISALTRGGGHTSAPPMKEEERHVRA